MALKRWLSECVIRPLVLKRMNDRQSSSATAAILLAGLLAFVFFGGFFQVSDCDVGYHLRTAEHILSGKGIPTTNTFSSSTPQHPWLLHQWVGTLLFYLPFALGGVGWLIAFKALLGATVMWLVWVRARSLTRPESFSAFWVITAGTIAARVRFFERPDLLSALYFALLLVLNGKYDKKRQWQWLGLPLLMAAWANTHAGVIYGFVLLALLTGADWLQFFVKRHRDPAAQNPSLAFSDLFTRPIGFLLSLLTACTTVQLLNPNGWRVLWFPISQFRSRFWQSIIVEYQPPTWAGDKGFYLFLGAFVLLQALTLRRVHWRCLLVSTAFAYLACSSQRSLLFFVIAAAPHAASMLDDVTLRILSARKLRVGRFGLSALMTSSTIATAAEDPKPAPTGTAAPKWQAVALTATWLAVALLVFVPNRTFRFGTGWYHPYYPLEIYGVLAKEVPAQGLFNEMRYGGSMLWWLYPKFKPFIDGRGDAYSEQFWLAEYLPTLAAKPGWQDTFAKYDLHGALLPLEQSGKPLELTEALLADTNWAVVAFNDEAVLLLERTRTNLPIIANCEFKVLRPGNRSFEWADDPAKRSEGRAETGRALALSPECRFARTAAARLAMSEGRFAEAATELVSILHDFPEAGETYWRDYGYVLCQLGRFDQADKIFSLMIKRKQLAGYACFMKYHIALERRDTAAAQSCLSRALTFEPNNPEYCLAQTNLTKILGVLQ